MALLGKLIVPFVFALLLLPINAFAHGSAEEHTNKSIGLGQISMYSSIGAGVLLVVFIILWIMYGRKVRLLNVERKKNVKEKTK